MIKTLYILIIIQLVFISYVASTQKDWATVVTCVFGGAVVLRLAIRKENNAE